MKTSKAYLPYRGLGLVSNDIPVVVNYVKNRKQNLIVTSVGNSFHVYEDKHLRLVNVGSPHKNPITSLAFDSNLTYSASGKMIYAWVRGTELLYTFGKHAGNVFLMMPFGNVLLAVDKKNVLSVWNKINQDLNLQMEFPKNFTISSLFHPPTAIDTIMFGSEEGRIQIWNIKTCEMLKNIEGWNSSVLVLEDTRTVDHVAIGLADGNILIYNWVKASIVRKFRQECGPVTSLSLRKDGCQILISGSSSGNIALWDLEENKLSSQLIKAHAFGVTGIECIENEPLMITSSADNSLKMWIFDLPDGGARVLKSREGFAKPPLLARFHGSMGDKILTSGGDSTLRVYSTISDVLNNNLGSAAPRKKVGNKIKAGSVKMPPIVKFSSEGEQNKSWDNVACVHKDLITVTTWSVNKSRMGKYKLKHGRFAKEFRGSIASAVELTVCGNFVFIGYDSGHIDKYNIQSGIYRGSLGESVAHTDTVSDIVCDGLNQCIISADLSGSLKWWEFSSNKEIHEIKFDDGLTVIILNRESGLLAVASEDMTIYVIDIVTKEIARKFTGHTNQIMDVIFSPDSKWIISSSLDGTIRTWDIPTSSCIDSFCVPHPAISLSMSPTREFLATVHTEQLGVYLWVVKNSYAHVSFYPLAEDFKPPMIALPSAGIDQSDGLVEESIEESPSSTTEDMDLEKYISPDQITDKFITLSLQPTSQWLNLLNVDIIKKRNKPVEAPKAPKAAPFFIQAVPGEVLDTKSDAITVSNKVSQYANLSDFGMFLLVENYEEAMKCLSSKGPSAIDFEIKNLDPDIGGSEELINNFFKMIKFGLTNKYFEVAQGYLGLFLKTHFQYIVSNEKATDICEKLLDANKQSWQPAKQSMNESLCLISYFKNASLINY